MQDPWTDDAKDAGHSDGKDARPFGRYKDTDTWERDAKDATARPSGAKDARLSSQRPLGRLGAVSGRMGARMDHRGAEGAH